MADARTEKIIAQARYVVQLYDEATELQVPMSVHRAIQILRECVTDVEQAAKDTTATWKG